MDKLFPFANLEDCYVEFRIGPNRYAIKATNIRAMHSTAQVVALPLGPSIVMGTLMISQQPLAVLDMKKILGLNLQDFNPQCVLVLEFSGQPLAMAVDEILRVAKLKPSEISAYWKDNTNPNFHGTYSDGGQSVKVLHLENILTAEVLDLIHPSKLAQSLEFQEKESTGGLPWNKLIS